MPLATFPYGTLGVNLLGCLLIGLIAGLAESRQLFGPEIRLFALIGRQATRFIPANELRPYFFV